MNTMATQSTDDPTKESTEQIQRRQLINLIRRQTDYDEETSEKKLTEHKQDVEAVIREFHGLSADSSSSSCLSSSSMSTNQKMFKAIREFF